MACYEYMYVAIILCCEFALFLQALSLRTLAAPSVDHSVCSHTSYHGCGLQDLLQDISRSLGIYLELLRVSQDILWIS